jgi:tetratricopeptide (TPR) repeat protein
MAAGMASEKVRGMNTCTGSLAMVGRVSSRLGLWLGGVSFLLLCSSCAVAHMPRTVAVDDMVSGSETGALGPEDILRRGEAYYHFMRSYASLRGSTEENQLDEAIAEIREALQVQPETVFLHTELARLQMRRGDMPAALQACQKALRLDPNYQPAYLVLGQIHANLQHKEEAQTAFRKAIGLAPLDEDG